MSLILMLARCPDCAAAVNVTHLLKEKMGLAQFFDIRCVDCSWTTIFCSSKQCDKLEPRGGRASMDVNRRMVVSFRENGLGYTVIKTFCRCMNMPPPMTQTSFDDTSCAVHNAYVETCHESMEKAAKEVRAKRIEEDPTCVDNNGVVNTKVSGDGAWQKRGYSSLNGVMTLISNGKCIDQEVMSKKCRLWEHRKGSDEYEQWKERRERECLINHEGSSGAMEITGLKRIYERSIENNKLRYTFYVGDGDTKSFNDLRGTNPYPGHDLVKGECIGHVQKRVGGRLRKIKTDYKGIKLSDGKGIGRGKGKLTEKVMNTLQNHYGMAIRQNTHSLYAMKKAVAAVVHHSTSHSSQEIRHQYCPRIKDSWCKYQQDKITGEITYKEHVNIDPGVARSLNLCFRAKIWGAMMYCVSVFTVRRKMSMSL